MSKRFSGEITGMKAHPVTNPFKIEAERLLVHITNDSHGKSLSIGSEKDDIQFTIPMERLMPYLE